MKGIDTSKAIDIGEEQSDIRLPDTLQVMRRSEAGVLVVRAFDLQTWAKEGKAMNRQARPFRKTGVVSTNVLFAVMQESPVIWNLRNNA